MGTPKGGPSPAPKGDHQCKTCQLGYPDRQKVGKYLGQGRGEASSLLYLLRRNYNVFKLPTTVKKKRRESFFHLTFSNTYPPRLLPISFTVPGHPISDLGSVEASSFSTQTIIYLKREEVLTYTLALVGDGDGVSSTTGGLTHVASAGVGALVDSADGPRHLRRTASRAAHAVRRQVLVQQTVLAGRTTDPVARACGQLRRSAPYLHSTHSQTSTTLHLTSRQACNCAWEVIEQGMQMSRQQPQEERGVEKNRTGREQVGWYWY